jgi:hypothetical protein
MAERTVFQAERRTPVVVPHDDSVELF